MRKSILFITVLIYTALGHAQPWFPETNEVFRSDIIPRLDITISPDSLDWIYDNVHSNHEFKALFVFSTDAITDTIENIGFRLRGATSRSSDKKSFKVSFNTFEKGRDYYGLQKMNINGEHNDPSIIRTFLAWDICHKINLIGLRSNHVDLYINNNYYGLYMNVEHIDDEYVKKRFDHENGNLYKCLYPASLAYLGENKETYKNNGYELKTNLETDDFSDLINLTKVLEDATSENLPEKLEPIFNVNGFLRYLAFEMLTGHWDAYSVNKSNYYLYHNMFTNKIEFIPYDTDNTFGIDWYNIDWGTRDMYNWWANWEDRPLTEKVLSNDTYRDRYSFFVNEIITKHVITNNYFQFIDDTKSKINNSAENDTYRTMDYGWSFDDYETSYNEALETNHVTYGLKPYFTTRIENIESQLELNSIAPIIENIYHNFPSLNEQIAIKANISDDKTGLTGKLFWKINDASYQNINFVAQTGSEYLATIPGISQDCTFNYYIEATDSDNNTSRDPYTGTYTLYFGSSDTKLRINEFMASNSESVFDNYGQTDDWLEVHNYGSEPIYLGDKYLSDEKKFNNKWKLPSDTLQAGAYYIIWIDGDTEQGNNHANFKLSSGGEFIGLYDNYSYNFAPIDTFTYTQQTSNVSCGKNASNELSTQSIITPGGENENINVAYITFIYNMNKQINDNAFNSSTDYIDIPGTFNNWKTNIKNFDNNTDGIIKTTYFGFNSNSSIEYKSRINSSWNTSEDCGDGNNNNRTFTTIDGHNIIEHWFNNEPVGITKTQQLASVYPNPIINTNLFVSSTNNISSYSIYNLNGKQVLHEIINSTNIQINKLFLPNSLFLLVIDFEDNKKEIHKIVRTN